MEPYYNHAGIQLWQGNCLEIMPQLEGGTVNLICADLPYGVTQNTWDSVLPLKELWTEYRRVLKSNGVVVLTGCQPFTTTLISSNPAWFRFADVWDKIAPTGHLNARKMPLRRHEDVCVFSPVTLGNFTYNPIMRRGLYREKGRGEGQSTCYGRSARRSVHNNTYYPTSIITVSGANYEGSLHPTQKPESLLIYLLTTYSNPGDLVLDNTCGSGTTLVAAKALGRRAIGIDLSLEYCRVAVQRLAQEVLPLAV